MSDQEPRHRTCYVCHGKVLARPTNDKRRHHCISLGEALCGKLPKECWQHQDHPFIFDILSTVLPYRQSDRRGDLAHQRRVDIARLVLSSTTTGNLDVEKFIKGASGFAVRHLRRFIGALPESSPLRDLLAKPIADITMQLALHNPRNPMGFPRPASPPKRVVELPSEFQMALDMYAEASHRRAKLKVERGHNYDPRTAVRRVEDARRFCEFLAENRVNRWATVAARHLDDFIVTVNRHAAQRAWTFLNFLYGRVPLLSKIPRPRDTPRHSGAMVAGIDDAKYAVARLSKQSDLQVAIAGLFLAMYAQTISHSCTLTLSQFRRQGNGLQVKFHGDWMPLDPLMDQLICQFRPEFTESNYAGTDELLFTLTCRTLSVRVAKVAGVALKPLRLAAISNLLRSGMTDRGAIVYYLGVSMPTIEDVERTTYWDLQSTVSPEIVEARNEVIRGERRE